MNIRWNITEKRFEAEFVDFQGDLATVKAAGFKTSGPPEWLWFTTNVVVLNKLRKNRPASDLEIYPEALAIYNTLNEQFEQTKKIKKELARQRLLARQQKISQPEPVLDETGEIDWSKTKWWIGKEDLPAPPEFKFSVAITPPPDLKCRDCGSPVYDFEYPEIPQCLWCNKLADEAVDEFFQCAVS